MKIKNLGTPLDRLFKDVAIGQGYTFSSMTFIKVPPFKHYRQDLIEQGVPEDAELPDGKDYIVRNAVNLEDGGIWNFSDEDVVQVPPVEVVVGRLPETEEEVKEATETLVNLPPAGANVLPPGASPEEIQNAISEVVAEGNNE